jgi:hypothetical protein
MSSSVLSQLARDDVVDGSPPDLTSFPHSRASRKPRAVQTAVAVKSALSQFDGDLKFFVSSESISAGDDWKSVLREELPAERSASPALHGANAEVGLVPLGGRALHLP